MSNMVYTSVVVCDTGSPVLCAGSWPARGTRTTRAQGFQGLRGGVGLGGGGATRLGLEIPSTCGTLGRAGRAKNV